VRGEPGDVSRQPAMVHGWYMSRTTIELDDELVAEVMRKYNLATKREAVDLALRRLVGLRLTKQHIDAVRGIGWEGDLSELRCDEIDTW
jgi:Arc/MetJ family transcription regulator